MLLEPGGYNLMHGGSTEPTIVQQDLDLTQLMAIRGVAAYKQGAGALLPRVQFSTTSSEVLETDGSTQIEVRLTRPLLYPATVEFYRVKGDATDGVDYMFPMNRTVTFAPGDVVETFTVTVANDGAGNDGGEYVEIGLRNPDWTDLGVRLVHTLTIND